MVIGICFFWKSGDNQMKIMNAIMCQVPMIAKRRKAALLFLQQCYVIRWKPDERGEEQVTNQVSMIAKGSRNRRPALLFLLQYYVMIKILWKSDEKGKWKRWLIRSQWLPKAAGKTAHLQLSQYDVLILLPKKILKIRWKRKMGKVTNQVPMIAKRRNRWPASSPLSVATRLRPSVSVCTAVCTVHCALCTVQCVVYTVHCAAFHCRLP